MTRRDRSGLGLVDTTLLLLVVGCVGTAACFLVGPTGQSLLNFGNPAPGGGYVFGGGSGGGSGTGTGGGPGAGTGSGGSSSGGSSGGGSSTGTTGGSGGGASGGTGGGSGGSGSGSGGGPSGGNGTGSSGSGTGSTGSGANNSSGTGTGNGSSGSTGNTSGGGATNGTGSGTSTGTGSGGSSQTGSGSGTQTGSTSRSRGAPAPFTLPWSSPLWLVLIVAGALSGVGAVVALRWRPANKRPPPRERTGRGGAGGGGDDDPDDGPVLDAKTVRAALRTASSRVNRGDDPREVVVGLYMELLESLALQVGDVASYTPEEIRAAHFLRLGATPEATVTLTRLFETARYSTHPMGTKATDLFASTLQQIQTDLLRDGEPR